MLWETLLWSRLWLSRFSVYILTIFPSRTVFILSEVLDEQLKALWFSPFHCDDMDTELDMVRLGGGPEPFPLSVCVCSCGSNSSPWGR